MRSSIPSRKQMSEDQTRIWELLGDTTDVAELVRQTGQSRKLVRDRIRRICRRYGAKTIEEAGKLSREYAEARRCLGVAKDFVYGTTARRLLAVSTTKQLDDLGLEYYEVVNPHYRSGPPARVYDLRDIARARVGQSPPSEVTRAKRREAALRAVETRKRKLRELVDSLPIRVPVHPLDDVRKQAIEHYNSRAWERGRDVGASEHDSQEFLDRITTNYIRHALTDYDYQLEDLRGQVGKDDAAERLHDRYNWEIWDKYPDLLVV